LHLVALANGRSAATLSLSALDSSGPYRVLVGTIAEERPPRVVALAPDQSRPSPEQWRGEIEATDDVIAAAVYTEDLSSGEWDTALVRVVSE
jgi:hypothetical protein